MNFSSIKKLIITVYCIMILIGILIVSKFIINSKKNNKKENINNATAKEINEKSRFLKEDGRVITDEDYIITLEKYYYESDINIGHCLISVMENGKKGKDIYCVLENKEITGGDMREVNYEYKYPITQLRFENGIDINNISYIKWKGIKF